MSFAKFAKIIAGVVGFLATIFAIIQGFRENRPAVARLQAALVNIEHVSAKTEIPDVQITLAFKGQPVPDFWLCRVRLENIGGITLYTGGPKANTQGSIVITVPQNYEILQIEPKGIDPQGSGFEAQIRQSKDNKGAPDKHQFEVSFEQWRKGEAIEAVLYLAGSATHLDRPKLLPKGRPILDGDVVPADLSSVNSPEIKTRSALTKLFGPYWASIFRVFAVVCLAIVIFLLIGEQTFGNIVRLNSLRNWARENPIVWGFLKLILVFGLYLAMFSMMP